MSRNIIGCKDCGQSNDDCRCDVLEAHVPVPKIGQPIRVFVCPLCFKQENTPHDKDCKWYGTYVDAAPVHWRTGESSTEPSGEINAAPEAVNHPSHYGGEDNPYEVIKVLKAWLTVDEMIGALKFQIIKYTPRAGKKDGQSASQDIAKAAWYADYLAKFLKENGR